jgi:hypothetical protein
VRQGKIKLGAGDFICDIGEELRDLVTAMIDPNLQASPTAAQLVQSAATVMQS